MSYKEYNLKMFLSLSYCVYGVFLVSAMHNISNLIHIILVVFIAMVYNNYAERLVDYYLLFHGYSEKGFEQARILIKRNLEVTENEKEDCDSSYDCNGR